MAATPAFEPKPDIHSDFVDRRLSRRQLQKSANAPEALTNLKPR
jgi:hypothetical protein